MKKLNIKNLFIKTTASIKSKYNCLRSDNSYLSNTLITGTSAVLGCVGIGLLFNLPTLITIGVCSVAAGVTVFNAFNEKNGYSFGNLRKRKFFHQKEEVSKENQEQDNDLTLSAKQPEKTAQTMEELINAQKETGELEEKSNENKEINNPKVGFENNENVSRTNPVIITDLDLLIDANTQRERIFGPRIINPISWEEGFESYISSMANMNEKKLGIQFSDNNMSYIEAYSILRKSDNLYDRIDAYTKLASSYGNKSNSRKQGNSNNYYVRKLKALSYYGHKIRNGEATKEEQELYLALLYNLGRDMDDDDVTDYLSSVYTKVKK